MAGLSGAIDNAAGAKRGFEVATFYNRCLSTPAQAASSRAAVAVPLQRSSFNRTDHADASWENGNPLSQ